MKKKFNIYLEPNLWHEYLTDSFWGIEIINNNMIVDNLPFYSNKVSCFDEIEVEEKEGVQIYKRTVNKSGHSTYRIFRKNIEDFDYYWNLLENFGCTYERGTQNFFAVDVPPEANIFEVYKILEFREKMNVWEFDEGHVGHQVLTR